jgi:type IV pilus assembly protein PilQ
VPFLGDVPLIGYLFKNTAHETTKTELLIFITPKIVTDKLATAR